MAATFHYLELHTSNSEQARGFYGELFGWKFSKRTTPRGEYYDVEGRSPEERGGLTTKPDEPPHWLPYVGTTTINETFTKAQQLGAKVVQPVTEVGEGSVAVLSDPTGAVFALWQVKKA